MSENEHCNHILKYNQLAFKFLKSRMPFASRLQTVNPCSGIILKLPFGNSQE